MMVLEYDVIQDRFVCLIPKDNVARMRQSNNHMKDPSKVTISIISKGKRVPFRMVYINQLLSLNLVAIFVSEQAVVRFRGI